VADVVDDIASRYESKPTSTSPTKNVTPRSSTKVEKSGGTRDRIDDALSSIAQRYGESAVGHATSAAANAGGAILDRLGVPKVMDLLDRPRQAVQSGIAHGSVGSGLSTLVHGATPEEQGQNREAVRAALGHLLGDAGFAQRYHSDPQWARGVEDFLVDTVTDPVVGVGAIVGGLKRLGVADHIAEAAAPALKPVRAANGAVAKKVGEATPALVKDNARAIADRLTVGGSAKRELGTHRYNAAIAADNRQSALEAEATRRLHQRFDETLGKLTPDDRFQVYQVLNGERDTRGMPQHLVDAVAQGRQLTKTAGGLYADESGRRKLAYGGGRLHPVNDLRKPGTERVEPPAAGVHAHEIFDPHPTGEMSELADALFGDDAALLKNVRSTRAPGALEHPVGTPAAAPRFRLLGRVDRPLDLGDLEQFAAPAEQGLLKAPNVRANYLPGPRSPERMLVDENAPARKYNLLAPRAPNLEEREAFTLDPKDVGAVDEAFRGMLANAARQGTAGRMRAELGVGLDGRNDPNLIRLFDRETAARGTARSLGQRNAEAWRNLVNVPKNTITTIGLKHGLVNVPALAAASEGPGAALEALLQGARNAAGSDAAAFERLKPGIMGGVIAPSAERANPIADTLARAPVVGPTIGKLAQGANRLTWAIDDAAKNAVYRRKVARGMDPTKAAAETLREMVDYRHASDFTKAMRNVAPFATFRTKIPAAVLSGLVRRPDRALTLDRATTGLYGSGAVSLPFLPPNDRGKTPELHDNTPISDVIEGIQAPQKYLRSTLADPLKALLSLPAGVGSAMGALSPSQARLLRYFTYGEPLLPHRTEDGQIKAGFAGQSLAGYVPYNVGEDALGLLGGSEFPAPDWASMLLGPTLGGYVR
jgi:hypothetical protein